MKLDANTAFHAWFDKRGVWPRLTYLEIFEAGYAAAQPDPAMAGDDLTDGEITAIAYGYTEGIGEGLRSRAVVPFAREVIKRAQTASGESLHKFLDTAAGLGLVLDGVDAADLYIELFPKEYHAKISA